MIKSLVSMFVSMLCIMIITGAGMDQVIQRMNEQQKYIFDLAGWLLIDIFFIIIMIAIIYEKKNPSESGGTRVVY